MSASNGNPRRAGSARCGLREGLLGGLSIALASLGFTQPALAQVADLVQIFPLQASETGGCYVGTQGTDHTIFLRNFSGFNGCDSFDPYDDYCIMRREYPADGDGGATISFGDSSLLRPSVTGDGTYAWFSRTLDLCFIETSSTNQDICYLLPDYNLFVHSATISPQGTRVAMVPRDFNQIQYPANIIQVRLVDLGAYPSLPLMEEYRFNAPLIFPETVDFMARGTWLVFDATNDQAGGGNWGLWVLDRAGLIYRQLAAPIPGYQLRNPAFAQTSDRVIAFDAVEIATGHTTVLTADIVSGEVREVAQIEINAGIPSFSGDDAFIVYNREDPGVYSTASLRWHSLTPDRLAPIGHEHSWIVDAGYGAVYRRGAFDTTEVACPATRVGGVGATLTLTKNAGDPALIDFAWGESCAPGAGDYSVHEGALGSWYDHTSELCSTGGATSTSAFGPRPGNRYFLVVPLSSEAEGGYGRDWEGAARPASTDTCRPEHFESICS